MQWLNGARRTDFNWQRAPLAQDAFKGKKIVVVGGTNGIGRALARLLADKGAEVTVIGRTFQDEGVPRLHFIAADLAQMQQARRVAQELAAETLDALIFTTGIFAGKQRRESPEGIELDLAVSYLSRLVILREVAPRLGKDRPLSHEKPRVLIMGFPGTEQKGNVDDLNSEDHYSALRAHANTVMGNEALVLDSATRYPQINFYGLNPGLIKSNIRAGVLGEGSLGQKLMELFIGSLFQSSEDYSEKIAPLLLSAEIEKHSGAMFNRHAEPIHASPSLTLTTTVQKIIAASERLAKKALEHE
jgi:NAD(P)-dependent dehydrogenase (short-subunit alcohol dehydrogenase family)